jgi:hypothetical protein
MMLILVTLGAFAITSAVANHTFSIKAHDWNVMFYALEDQAEHYVKDVDALLIEAAGSGGDYIITAHGLLETLEYAYPGSIVTFEGNDLFLYMDFVSDDNEFANLSVTLRVNGGTGQNRYDVLRWQQWVSQPEAAGMIIWDGLF